MGNCNCTNKQEIQNVNIIILTENNNNHQEVIKNSSKNISKFVNDSHYIQTPLNTNSKNLNSIISTKTPSNRQDNNIDDVEIFKKNDSESIIKNDIKMVKEEKELSRKNSNESLITKIRRKSTCKMSHKSYDINTIQKLLSGKAISYDVRIALCGDPLVGKSSIAIRYAEKKYDSFYSISFFIEKQTVPIRLNDNLYNLLIYVTIGNEKYRKKNEEVIQNSDIILLVFDLSQKKSLNTIIRILEKMNKTTNVYLIGNKNDLRERRISNNQINEICQNRSIRYFEVSAKTGMNVDNMFLRIIENFHKI